MGQNEHINNFLTPAKSRDNPTKMLCLVFFSLCGNGPSNPKALDSGQVRKGAENNLLPNPVTDGCTETTILFKIITV